MGRPRKPPAQRILEYTRRSADGCLVWIGALNKHGYGKVTVPRDRVDWRNGMQTMSAHRLAWELRFGPVPAGLTLDHLCRNRACVELTHLEPVTQRENILRGKGHAARNSRKTRCVNGHDFAGRNLYISPEGYRYCRICRNAAVARYRARKAA